MYIVTGTYTRNGTNAVLKYETLDEALQKLRDLVEADEIDDQGPMFREYGLRLEPLPLEGESLHEEPEPKFAGAPRLRLSE